MEPLRTTVDDNLINSKYSGIIHRSRLLSIPLVRCDDQLVFNRIIKQENINCQVFNRIIKKENIGDQVFNEIKEEIIDETDHHNDGQLLQIGSSVVPFPLNVICGDQEFKERIIKKENIKQENTIIKEESNDDQVLNGIIKKEIIDEADHHNDGQLLQIGSSVVPFPLNAICGDQEFKERIIKKENIKQENTVIKEESNDDQVLNGIIKKEIIDEADHHNDGQLLQIGSSVVPFPLNAICGDQEFKERIIKKENIKQENTVIKEESNDDQVLNGIIKKEIIDEADHHNDGQLLQKRTKTVKENSIKTEIKAENDLMDSCEFEGTILNESNSSEFTTCKDSNLTTNHLNKNPLTDNCDKMSTASNSTIHTSTPTRKNLYKCDFCDIKFSKVSRLTEHTRTHTGEKPYKCDICDAKFSTASNLTRHTRSHPGQMPYKCFVCDTGFHQANHLKRHKLTHIERKLYKCKICDTGFSKSFHLTRHIRTHTGEKPFKCTICNKSLSSKWYVTAHINKTHTGEKPHKCDICEQAFTHISNLKKHRRDRHMTKKTV